MYIKFFMIWSITQLLFSSLCSMSATRFFCSGYFHSDQDIYSTTMQTDLETGRTVKRFEYSYAVRQHMLEENEKTYGVGENCCTESAVVCGGLALVLCVLPSASKLLGISACCCSAFTTICAFCDRKQRIRTSEELKHMREHPEDESMETMPLMGDPVQLVNCSGLIESSSL